MHANPETGIAILAKAPVPGYAKTRLIPRLGAAGAAALQAEFLARTVRTALAAGIGPVTLWCSPDTAHPAFAACAADGQLRLHGQPGGDLGARMAAAVAGSCAEGGTLVIGTDCPALTATGLRAAAAALADHDAVLIPAEDGGYVLIGLRRTAPSLFRDIPWSTPQVLAATRDRLRAAGLSWHEPAALWDVDHPADLARLAATHPELAGAPGSA
jgi:rSAM/selenodomain-associated transferase 1